MNENKKLKEAKYFLEIMQLEKVNGEIFENYLSAFLSASRSILYYANEECKKNKDSKSWYKLKTLSSPVIEFLRKKRNLNVHLEPLKTQVQHLVKTTVTILVSGMSIIKDQEGNIISKREFGQQPQNTNINTIKSDVIYKFNDWPGSEDVITLCDQFIKEIETFIEEGRQLGYLAE